MWFSGPFKGRPVTPGLIRIKRVLGQRPLSHITMYVGIPHFQIAVVKKTTLKKPMYVSTILASKLIDIDLNFFGVKGFSPA